MAFGDSPADAALREAWYAFCARLAEAGDRVFKDHNPANVLQRADGFRFLTQNLGQAFDLALETRDPRFPALHDFCNPTRKLGGDAGDFVYHQAWIHGGSEYRVTGNRGTARFLNFTVQGPRASGTPLHEPFGDTPEANLFGHQLETAPDGSFELYLGGEPRSTNWLPTTPGTRKLFVRQGFDRWDERPAKLRIERIGMAEPQPLPTPARMAEAVDWAGGFLAAMMDDWPDWPFAHGGVDPANPNAFPAPAETSDDRKRGRAAANMHWVLAPDEALIVEFEPHEGLWMLTNMGAFFNSMDYRYRPVSYTPSRTVPDPDGTIRLILSHDDSGHPNWLDTQGFERGNLTYRHMLEGAPVPLATRLVKRADLPQGPVTHVERAAQLRERFEAIARRYA